MLTLRFPILPTKVHWAVRQVSWLMALLRAVPSRQDDPQTVALAQPAIYSCGAASGLDGIPFSSRPGAGHRTMEYTCPPEGGRWRNIPAGAGNVKNNPTEGLS